MAIESELPSLKPTSMVSNSSSSVASSSSSPLNNRRPLVQVATNNSSTFIQFPRTARRACPFVPIGRPRTRQSSTRLSIHTTETQSTSSANAPTSSIVSGDVENKRNHSEQRTNPILTNPLLNHRKEQPKTPPMKSANEYLRTTRLCLSSKPFRTTTNETQMPIIRVSTAPVIAHSKETNSNTSDRLILPIDKKTSEQQQKPQYVDDNKYDYITRWLNEVRAATCSANTLLSKTKRTKRELVPS